MVDSILCKHLFPASIPSFAPTHPACCIFWQNSTLLLTNPTPNTPIIGEHTDELRSDFPCKCNVIFNHIPSIHASIWAYSFCCCFNGVWHQLLWLLGLSVIHLCLLWCIHVCFCFSPALLCPKVELRHLTLGGFPTPHQAFELHSASASSQS